MARLSDFAQELLDTGNRTLRYGYFAPIQAAWLMWTRKGGYFRHLRALYRRSTSRSSGNRADYR